MFFFIWSKLSGEYKKLNGRKHGTSHVNNWDKTFQKKIISSKGLRGKPDGSFKGSKEAPVSVLE